MDHILFAQVTKITPISRVFSLTGDHTFMHTNTGHKIQVESETVKTNNIKVGQYRFFSLLKTSSGKFIYHDSNLTSLNEDSPSHDVMFQNLTHATDNLIASLRNLETAERNLVLRAAGTVITGVGTVTAAVTAVQSFFAWEPVTFMTSTAISGGLGLLTYLQAESLSLEAQRATELFKRFEASRSVYRTTVFKYGPRTSFFVDKTTILNPELKGLVTKLHFAFKEAGGSFDLSSLFSEQVQYCPA